MARLRQRVVVEVAELGVGGVAARAPERAGLRERHARQPGALRHGHGWARLRLRPGGLHRGGRAAGRRSACGRVSNRATGRQRRQAGWRRHQVVVVTSAAAAAEETLKWQLLHLHLVPIRRV
uniref:Uncharacterized protein n=1 Tax=Arundo donax TaxID=35708 RepID=A0A0A9DHL2_ARUDO